MAAKYPAPMICPHFLKNSCKFGDTCKNLHSTDDKEPSICYFYLKGNCRFGNSCMNIHSQPYQWQYFSTDEEKWVSFEEDNEGIEKGYSDPQKERCRTIEPLSGGRMEINLDRRVGKIDKNECKIRRISTQSAGDKDATEWLWYFRNDENEWQEYIGSMNSDLVERKFQEDPKGIIQLSTSRHKYELDFSKKKQINIQYGTVRDIRSRPRFQTKSSMEERSRLNSSPLYPDHWDLKQLFSTVRLDDPEISKIHRRFAETMPNVNLKSVRRIQNPELWEDFSRIKQKMKKQAGRGEVEERLLFHGTDPQYIDDICRKGFDWRLAGMSTGTKYGVGSYFATEAFYSDQYNFKSKMLLVVRVLVGAYTIGHHTDRLPALKGSSRERYDSSVDDVHHPRIFVIFEKFQTYPEYLIEY